MSDCCCPCYDYTGASGGGAVNSVAGTNGITPTAPQTGAVVLDGVDLLPRDGTRAMTGHLNFDTFAAKWSGAPLIRAGGGFQSYTLPEFTPNEGDVLAGFGIAGGSAFYSTLNWKRDGLGRDRLYLQGNGGATNVVTFNPNGLERGYVGFVRDIFGAGNSGVGIQGTALAPFFIENNGVLWRWPGADGTSGQVLTTNGAGNLSWSTPSGSGGGPAVFEVLPRTATAQTASINTIYLTKFVAKRNMTISSMGFGVYSASGGDSWLFGIYNAALTTLLAQGSFVPSVSGWVTQALSGSVVVTAGTEYWAAWKGTNGSATVASMTGLFNAVQQQRSLFDSGVVLPASAAAATATNVGICSNYQGTI